MMDTARINKHSRRSFFKFIYYVAYTVYQEFFQISVQQIVFFYFFHI